ncbi:inner membrane protein YpjD [Xylella taiwanensis]|uniref:Cytochrome c biogenesis protein CcsA n=1 Tax=Xylella taiwanensis TaxID=1444770 RepID=A0ABS8TVD1_9GAMM|nr:cytochrome c biogenesis protein CcsA [Xylella taiwanensis]AXI82527.1 membrane protein [Xylella taiwanensis]AXI82606.1 membrane protein [Xylella taiwanensis]MCD8455517.1 cytochrome c biogenesis protein CcsA [Xylella taiwanensis]MCD8455603.1 cytochrome c biogenesis protein CcsA [Xylella taiwanensis]MCD8457925.1 cytochrome c biogenesis protein CcsA [Xylella taiwanensis]
MLIGTLLLNDVTQRCDWRFPALVGLLAHGGYHFSVSFHSAWAVDMHFFAALSLTGLVMSGLTILFGTDGPMGTVGVVVFPLAGLLLGVYHSYGHSPSTALGWRVELHAWLALLGYATLSIAALLAMMLWFQERALRRRNVHRWRRALPPLTELEKLLFRMITVGFVLLTFTVFTGLLFVKDFLEQKLLHKSVLSVLSWVVFGALLIGRWRYGWRGIKAVHWTLTAMTLLVFAFFGSKLVIELILSHQGGSVPPT